MKDQAKRDRFIAALICSCVLIFLFTNCSKFENRSVSSGNDLVVIGPDGQILSSLQPQNTGQQGQQKLYWNNSGDPTNAPRWAQKTINWYYNPDGQPPQFTESQALDIIQNGMKTWESVCGIKWVYQGLTNLSDNTHNDSANTIGWSGNPSYAGLTSVRLGRSTSIAEADIDLTTAQVTDATTLQGVINHELGHQLGLEHSDVVESIMYANPYHPVNYLLTLRQDDIDGCVGLYGQPGAAEATPSPTPAPVPVGTPTKSANQPAPVPNSVAPVGSGANPMPTATPVMSFPRPAVPSPTPVRNQHPAWPGPTTAMPTPYPTPSVRGGAVPTATPVAPRIVPSLGTSGTQLPGGNMPTVQASGSQPNFTQTVTSPNGTTSVNTHTTVIQNVNTSVQNITVQRVTSP